MCNAREAYRVANQQLAQSQRETEEVRQRVKALETSLEEWEHRAQSQISVCTLASPN